MALPSQGWHEGRITFPPTYKYKVGTHMYQVGMEGGREGGVPRPSGQPRRRTGHLKNVFCNDQHNVLPKVCLVGLASGSSIYPQASQKPSYVCNMPLLIASVLPPPSGRRVLNRIPSGPGLRLQLHGPVACSRPGGGSRG